MKPYMRILGTSVFFSVAYFLEPTVGQADADSLLIIANNTVPEKAISVAEARRLFLKERANWSSGGKALPVNAKPGTPERRAFQSKVLGMDMDSETAYWQEQKIKKGVTPPPEFSNTQKAVFSLRGSIGYCLKSQYRPGTSKVLLSL